MAGPILVKGLSFVNMYLSLSVVRGRKATGAAESNLCQVTKASTPSPLNARPIPQEPHAGRIVGVHSTDTRNHADLRRGGDVQPRLRPVRVIKHVLRTQLQTKLHTFGET